jgi:hypothetical protein
MTSNRLSDRERGEENLVKVRRYLASLEAASQSLPLEDGRPNITPSPKPAACSVTSSILMPVRSAYLSSSLMALVATRTGPQASPALSGNRDSRTAAFPSSGSSWRA